MGFASRFSTGLPVPPTFWAIFPWSALWRISKNGRFWCLCEIGHSLESRELLEPQLRQNFVRWLHLKPILIRRRRDLRRGVLGAREFGLLFGRFSLGPHFEESIKMADFGVFDKFAIARGCEHFWSRSLRRMLSDDRTLIFCCRAAFRCNYTGDFKNLGKNCVTFVTC